MATKHRRSLEEIRISLDFLYNQLDLAEMCDDYERTMRILDRIDQCKAEMTHAIHGLPISELI